MVSEGGGGVAGKNDGRRRVGRGKKIEEEGGRERERLRKTEEMEERREDGNTKRKEIGKCLKV